MYQILIGVTAAVVIAGAGMAYYTHTKNTIESLRNDLAVSQGNELNLKNSLEEEKASIRLMDKQREEERKKLNSLNQDLTKAREEANALRKKFARHDLDALSLRKPGLIEKIINKGTAKVFKEVEKMTDNQEEVPEEQEKKSK